MATWKIGVVWQPGKADTNVIMVLFVFFRLSVSWRSFFLPFVCPACSFLPPFIPHSLLCNYMGVCHTRYWEPLLRTNSSLNLAALVSDNLAYSWQSFRFFKTEGCKSWEDAGLFQHSEKKISTPSKTNTEQNPKKQKQKESKWQGRKAHNPSQASAVTQLGIQHKRVQRVPLVFGIVGLLLATSWVSFEDALCLSPPPATTTTSSLVMNYTGASGQHLIRGLPSSTSPFPVFFLLWGSLTTVPAWKVLDKQEQLGSYKESCHGGGFFYPLGDRNSRMKSFLFLLQREV